MLGAETFFLLTALPLLLVIEAAEDDHLSAYCNFLTFLLHVFSIQKLYALRELLDLQLCEAAHLLTGITQDTKELKQALQL